MMIRVRLFIRASGEILKRALVRLAFDDGRWAETYTDRIGVASFEQLPGPGKILVEGIPRFHGQLEGDIELGIWSLLDAGGADDRGTPGSTASGSTAYPNMQTRTLEVEGTKVHTDSEGYLVDLADWSEAFTRAQATAEGLELGAEHWEVIRYLRGYYETHQTQAQVRAIIQHFRRLWGLERGTNHYLHQLFPRGGPQKQGNRLAGLMKTKGEH